jgi:hypothetical protein
MSDHGYGPFHLGDIPDAAGAFGRLLFEVAQDHLDPAHQRLQWSEGFTGAPTLHGPREFGRKFSWAEPFDAGEAMVYVAVGDPPGGGSFRCGQYDNPDPTPCFSMTLDNGSPALALSRPTRLELHWRRPDESYVFAIVDSTFRNNTVVASTSALPTLGRLEAFVTDPRLVLPPQASAS